MTRNKTVEVEKMNLRRYIKMTILLLTMGCLLAGCSISNPKESEELAFRQKGIEALQGGDYEGAIEQFQKALDSSNGRISSVELDICYYKAYSQILAGKYEDALTTYNALLEYDKGNGDAYLLRGNLQVLLGDVDAACKDYNQAVKSNGEFQWYMYAYEQLAGMGYDTQAISYLQRALEVKAKDKEDYRQRGQIYIILGEYALAKEELSKAQNLGDEESKLYMAQVLELEGNYEAAKGIYENYAKLHENNAYACERLAGVFVGEGRYEDALVYIQQAKTIGELHDEATLLKNEIIAYERMGDYAKAKELLGTYMEKFPLDAVAKKELIFLNSR